MPDVATAVAPAPAPAAAAVASSGPAPRTVIRSPERAQRRAAAIAKLQAGRAVDDGSAAAAAAPAHAAPTAPAAAPAATASKPAAAAAGAPVESPKPIEAEKADPATERALRSIEQAKQKWLDERKTKEAELEVKYAEVARLRKEAEGKVSSRDELRKLSPTDLLDAFDHFSEDDFDVLSRASYARTKAGKTDPRAQAAAQDAARAQGGRTQLAQLQARLDQLETRNQELETKLLGEFTRRDQVSYAERWVGEAVKAIPADKPTFLSKLHANEPDTAKRELLAIGAELEKANDGEPPTHAEVVAEFEKRKRAQFKAMGIDADALLAPPKPAAAAPSPKPAAVRTLDIATPNLTRQENAPKTRDERRAVAIANLRARLRTTADQM